MTAQTPAPTADRLLVETYQGVEVYVTSDAKFEATIGDAPVVRASKAGIRAAIRGHGGAVRGLIVPRLTVPPPVSEVAVGSFNGQRPRDDRGRVIVAQPFDLFHYDAAALLELAGLRGELSALMARFAAVRSGLRPLNDQTFDQGERRAPDRDEDEPGDGGAA